MKNILYILVTCSKEITRHNTLIDCINSIKDNFDQSIIDDNFLIFDNDSIVETKDLLLKNFNAKNIYFSDSNVGLWSAVNYGVSNYQNHLGEKIFDYVFPIESDLFIYDAYKLNECVEFLNNRSEIPMIRMKEFEVNNQAKFDRAKTTKSQRTKHTMKNLVTNEKAKFLSVENSTNLYLTNLHGVMPGLHRTSILSVVLDELSCMKSFNELDFMKRFQKHMPTDLIGQLDMGIYYEVSFDNKALMGSYISSTDTAKINYFNSRQNNNIKKLQDK